MQTVSGTFDLISKGDLRPLNWSASAAFDKVIDDDITFFTLNVSVLDGSDVLSPSDADIIQEWDKYEYTSYRDRVVSIEVTREEPEPYAVMRAYGDITLNNFDQFFTPNSGSPIGDFILPRRPFRLGMGFGSDTLPQMVGVSDGMPEIDRKDRLASFHIIDFMEFLLSKDVGSTIILENKYTSEIIDYLLQYMGMNPDRYELDQSFNKVSFFYVEKGTKFGVVIRQLIEAEMGRFFMDELGVIRFKNRYNYNTNSVFTFDQSNIINYQVSDESLIINSVVIKSDVRRVQPLQSVWTSLEPIAIAAGATVDVWANFTDPVTASNVPVYSSVELHDSYYSVFLDTESANPYGNVTLSTYTPFSKSVKLTFANTGGDLAYITVIDIYGTPAKAVDHILVEETDPTSITNFEEQLYEIDNPYIQDKDTALSRALTLLRDYKDFGSAIELDVKGTPALQLGDHVTVNIDGYNGLYAITKITNIISESSFTQRLRATKKNVPSFFTLDVSELNGTDVLGL